MLFIMIVYLLSLLLKKSEGYGPDIHEDGNRNQLLSIFVDKLNSYVKI